MLAETDQPHGPASPLQQLHREVQAEQLPQVGPVAGAVVDEDEVVGPQPELLSREGGGQVRPEALVVDARSASRCGRSGEVELVELLGDHGDPRRSLHQARVVERVDEVVGAELVEAVRGQSPEPLVGQPQRGGEQVFLVVLEVHDVGSAEGRDGALRRLADHLARRPGADHGLVRIA